MAIKLGNTSINKLYLGSTEIKKAYLGSTLIFDNTAESIPTGNLIRYYRFNNDVTDEVGLGDGTPASITYVTGKSGQAADFNGTNSLVVVADANDLSFTDGNDLPFSVSMYVKMSASNSGVIYTKSNNNGLNIEWNCWTVSGTNSIYFRLYSGGLSANRIGYSTSTLNIGQWYHIVMTYDGSELLTGINIYLNGVLDTVSDVSAGTYVRMINTTSNLNIGDRNNNSFPLDGGLDGLGIWDKELSQAEVTAIYNKQNAGNEIL